MNDNNITCPFCGEEGFTKVMLKVHLLGGQCAEFDETNVFVDEVE